MPKPSLSSSLKKQAKRKRTEPVWGGPEKDGITFSLLTRFLSCRERFRLLVVEGLKPQDQFNHRIEFGNMWHVCEEAHARGINPLHQEPVYPGSKDLTWGELLAYCQGLCHRYPHSQEQIDHWYRTTKVQFPEYVKYWSEHPDVIERTPLLQEQTFDVPYKLPSGRVVRLRGKWDSVDLIGKGKEAGIYLQENKTKGDIREDQIQRQLTFDLQTMLYLVAMVEFQRSLKEDEKPEEEWAKVSPFWEKSPGQMFDYPILGVRYNVIRRPFSGGEGDIKQRKGSKNVRPETKDEFYERFRGVLTGQGLNSKGEPYAGPSHWFMRWKVEITPGDIQRFRRECLDPILEQLCDWWQHISNCVNRPEDLYRARFSTDGDETYLHWRHPFGSINWLDEGGASDLDEYMATGSEAGLQRIDNLFPEL